MGKRKHKETFTTDYLELLADGDFTTYHYKVMLLLLTGTFTQAQLAKRLNIKEQNIHRCVKKLMEHGYIINTETVGREKYFTANRKFKETNLITNSEPDSATEKVATNSNFLENIPEVSGKDCVEIYDDNFSENDFSENIPVVSCEDYIEIYDDDFSVNDSSEPDSATEKVDTYVNFSEDNFGEPNFIDKFQLGNDFTEDNAEKPETQIIFRDDRHKKLYNDFCGRMECLDCYHRSLAYLLALDSVLREKVESVFNFEDDGIIFDALYNGFQTVISMKTTRLAFNLWNGCCYDIAEKSEVFYTPEQIFSFREYAPYYWQAIKIRFEIETND